MLIWAWHEKDPEWDTTANPPNIKLDSIKKHDKLNVGHSPVIIVLNDAMANVDWENGSPGLVAQSPLCRLLLLIVLPLILLNRL